jgi:uncharacterized protein (TIGR03643 family)
MKKIDLSAGPKDTLSEADVSAIIAMAWQDDTPFEAITMQFGVQEAEVIALMREHLKARSFRVWRTRVRGRVAKHQALQKIQTHDRSATRSPAGERTSLNPQQQAFDDDSEALALPVSEVTAQSLR